MNILVIGGNGFVGRAFVEQLLNAGHLVTVVSRSEVLRRDVAVLAGGIEALCARPGLLEAADIVCHLASATIPSTSNAAPLSDIDGNLRPMVDLLETMRAHGNRRILFLSSGGAIYGRPEAVPIREDHPRLPISHYGLTKLMIETYLDYYAREHGFAPVVIRPANPYGPGQGKIGQLGAVTTFLRMINEGQTATLYGDGSTVRDFVHVDDLCDLMWRAIEARAVGTFNCGGGMGTSLIELIAQIEVATGKTLRIDRKPARPFDPPAIVLDITRARNELGWEPQISLEAGIHELSKSATE